MSDFRQVNEALLVSPQIDVSDVTEAKARGVTLIVNNRPDDEEPGQIAGSVIEAAAKSEGIAYRAIPITHAGFSEAQVDAMAEAMQQANGPALAFCRSGTRSTLLWALASAKQGGNASVIASQAAAAGYDISPIRQLVDMLSAGKE